MLARRIRWDLSKLLISTFFGEVRPDPTVQIDINMDPNNYDTESEDVEVDAESQPQDDAIRVINLRKKMVKELKEMCGVH